MIADPTLRSVGLLPGKLSANKACKATASLVLPTKCHGNDVFLESYSPLRGCQNAVSIISQLVGRYAFPMIFSSDSLNSSA
jgi:hypothetical protein